MATINARLTGLSAVVIVAVIALLLWQLNAGIKDTDNPALTEAVNQQLYQHYFPQQVEH